MSLRRRKPQATTTPADDATLTATPTNVATTATMILTFDQINMQDTHLVGGKGANLGHCKRANLPVPNGFCITAAAFDDHLATHNLYVDTADPNTARDVILHRPLSNTLVQAIYSAYETLGSTTTATTPTTPTTPTTLTTLPHPLVAVRSSATAEDGAAASFAGQMDTLLGISTPQDVVTAVRHCWASVFADRVSAYRNLAGGAGSCCVVVQLLVQADAAGVMFTANPLSGNINEFVITANWGLGESVVADLTTPDTFVLQASTGATLSSDIGTKTKMVVLVQDDQTKHSMPSTPAPATSTPSTATAPATSTPRLAMAQEVPIPLHQQQIPCITAQHLAALLQLGRQVLAHYNNVPQDIEWAIHQNQLYLLQSRPITTLQHSHDQPEHNNQHHLHGSVGEFDSHCQPNDWLTTCNAQEMFPGAGTPLTISVFGHAVEYGMQHLHMDYIRTMPGYDANVLRTGWFNGHFFINMTNTLYMLTQMLGGDMGKQNGEMSILGRINQHCTMSQLNAIHGTPWLPIRVLNSLGYLYAVKQAQSRIGIMRARAEQAPRLLGIEKYKDPSKDTATSVYLKLQEYRSEYNQQWADGIMCSSTSAAFMLLVMKLVCTSDEMWSTTRVSEIASALVSDPNGEEQVESADAVRQLDVLKEAIAAHKDGALFVHEWDLVQGQAWLEGVGKTVRGTVGETVGEINEIDPERTAIATAFAALLARHGHRCVKEAEFRNEDWGENPSVLVKLLQNSVKAQLKVNQQRSDTTAETILKEEEEEEDKLDVLLKNEWSHIRCCWRPLLRYAVSCARAGVRRREMSKSLQVKVHSSMKRGFRWLGQLMVTERILNDIDLLYFFTFEELGDLILHTHSKQDLTMRAIKRRRLLPTQQRMTFPDLVQGKPVPKPPSVSVAAGTVGFKVVGTPVSRGTCEGYARVVRTIEEASDLEPGEVLICPFTDVGWTPYFSLASGLVTEIGGLLSHGAVVAREYGLPCVVNVDDACSRFVTGMMVRIEGSTGTVTVVEC